MELTWQDDIRPSKRPVCFDTSEQVPKAPLILYKCHGQRGNQWWKYNVVSTEESLLINIVKRRSLAIIIVNTTNHHVSLERHTNNPKVLMSAKLYT